MTDLATAFGLMLVIEGLLYALFPNFMRKSMAQLLMLTGPQVRALALVTAFIGLAIVWFIRG